MSGHWRAEATSRATLGLIAATVGLLGIAILQRARAIGPLLPADQIAYGFAALSLGWAAVRLQPASLAEGWRMAGLVLAGDVLVLSILRMRGLVDLPWLAGERGVLVGGALGLVVAAILLTQQMSWIALKMLTGDKAKFFGIVLGLTFAALLITQQGSIFCGLMRRTAGQVEDIRGADLWVMDPNVRFIDDVKPMLETSLYRVRGVEGVEWAVPLYKGNARLKLQTVGRDGQRLDVIEQVILLGLDDASLVGAPPPERVLCGSLDDLRKTDAIMIDYSRLKKLFPGENWDEEPQVNKGALLKQSVVNGFIEVANKVRARRGQAPWVVRGPSAETLLRERQGEFARRFLGREVEMNDHRGVIVSVCEATRTFQSNPVVYTLYSRAKRFVPAERKLLSYVLAKTSKDPSGPGDLDPMVVAERISRQTGLKARTSEEFLWETMAYYFVYTGIPINFGITTLLGFLVGTAIAGQTFYNFTIENLKQFGSLKAMGATNGRIVGMILLQAMVVGLLGYGLGVGLATFSGVMGSGGELAFFTWWPVLPITAVAIVMICILSSILCIRRVIVLEPAVVFRGLIDPEDEVRLMNAAMTEAGHAVASMPSPPLAPPAMEGDVAVRIRGVAKHFGRGEQRVTALKGIDWDVYKGQMSMIIGPSGCGKTTLLSVVAGILNCDEGSVEIFGEEVSRFSDGRRTSFRSKNIGFIFQQYNLLPALTAAENAAIPLVIAGWPRAKAVNRAREVLSELGMGKKTEALPSQLSGGQQQRVAISRSLVHSPRLLVCDEPTAALDHETGLTVMEMLRKAAVRPDRAVIVVTHDNRVFHFGDRIARMDDGRMVEVVEKPSMTAGAA